MGDCRRDAPQTNQGFTLIELLVAMAIGSIVMGCLYSVFTSQQRIHVMHQQVVNAQQSLRTCIYLMEQEIKQACLDPQTSAHPAILTAAAHTFEFQYDRNGNGHDFTLSDASDPRAAKSGEGNDPHEYIRYRLSADTDEDGRADSFPCKLYRYTWDFPEPMAEQIEVLNFVYRDEHGTVLSPLPLNQTNRAMIRTVEVTLIARSTRLDTNHLDTRTYTNRQGDTLIDAPNDHYHRKALSKAIRLRNL